MVDVTTPNLGLTLPTVGADDGAWGGIINADLTAIDALWVAIGDVALGTAATKSTGFFVQAANNLSDLASEPVARTNLGLGTAATQNTGTSGANIPLLNGANTWGSAQTFQTGFTSTGDVTVERSGTPTQGYVFFGNTGAHSIGFDGANIAATGSGALTPPSGGFLGNLTGNVTGNVSGSSGSCTGDAATAAALSSGAWTVFQRGSDGWLEFNYGGTIMMSLSNIDGTLKVRGPIIMNTVP